METGCIGSCDLGPVVVCIPRSVLSEGKSPDVTEIVSEHLGKGRPVQRLFYQRADTGDFEEKIQDIDFFNRQTRVALRNTGVIDPMVIEEYIARDGYQALGKV